MSTMSTNSAVRRYAVTTAGARQRLTAPILVLVVATAILQVSGGGLRATVAVACGYLFPVAAWLTVAVVGADPDPTRALVAVGMGGTTRLRQQQRIAAAGLAGLGGAVAFVGGVLTDLPHVSLEDVAACLLALVLSVCGGVALGSLCAPPVIARPGWSLTAIAAVSVTDLAVPVLPPVGLAIRGLGTSAAAPSWPLLAGATVATAALVTVARLIEDRMLRRCE
ncbi:MAG: hypothetical protein QM747_05800 [Nocardioides sp.]